MEFRFQCRQYNNEVSFASYGINYGEEANLPTPSFIKISGHIYSRLLNAEDDGTLRYYVHDATYRRNKKLPLETLRIVRDCISAKNNLAQELQRFSQMPNMEELIVTIETNPSNIGAPDVAALYVRTKGDTTTHPRRLVIYPTRKSFHDAHPDLDNTRGQNGLFVPSSHEMYEPLLYPLLAGAVPTIGDLVHTSSRKDRSKGTIVYHHDNKNIDIAQFAFFAQVVDPITGAAVKELKWRLGPQNATTNFTLDPTGGTTNDYKKNYHLKLRLTEGRPMFDPNGKYSLIDTVNLLRQVDLETQKHAGNVCSAIIGDFKRLHEGKSGVMFKEFVDLVRGGDKVLHTGAIATPHTKIIRAFCNTPHFWTTVYTSKCPCSEWLRVRRLTQPCCGWWQGRFAKPR